MSWRCPKCGYYNIDKDTSCYDCGYQSEKTLSQEAGTRINTAFPMTTGSIGTGQPEANVPQSPASQEEWVIVCPDCGCEIPVESEDAELEICPVCKHDSVENVHAAKREGRPVQAEEQPVRHPRLFIQEIRAIPEISNKFIYHQKGRIPEPVSDKIEILPPQKEFGRNDLPKQGDYYRTISERHCRFRYDSSGDWFVSDLNSTNGTIANSRRLIGEAEVRLTDGSEIQLANRLFIVFIE